MSETNLTVVIDDPDTARSMFLLEVELLIEERSKAVEEGRDDEDNLDPDDLDEDYDPDPSEDG